MPDTDEVGTKPEPDVLRDVLVEARQAGFLGPGPIERHLVHARGFVVLAQAQAGGEPAWILDLGSGGGLPGLVVASNLRNSRFVLLEANERRAEFLERAVLRCALEGRVEVVQERAEIFGRDPVYRGAFSGVVVRSFGPPAVVAECAAPLLQVGGWLIVSEPPTESVSSDTATADTRDTRGTADITAEPGRWPADQLSQLGLHPEEFVRKEFGYQIVRQVSPCPDRFPRRNGVPSKRPLF